MANCGSQKKKSNIQVYQEDDDEVVALRSGSVAGESEEIVSIKNIAAPE